MRRQEAMRVDLLHNRLSPPVAVRATMLSLGMVFFEVADTGALRTRSQTKLARRDLSSSRCWFHGDTPSGFLRTMRNDLAYGRSLLPMLTVLCIGSLSIYDSHSWTVKAFTYGSRSPVGGLAY
jgi:hypothetical protein